MKPITMNAPLVALEQIARIQKGSTITAKNAVKGEVPVIAGGIKPAYFHSESNREANAITVSASGAAGYVSFHPYPIYASDCITVESLDLAVVDQKYMFLALLSMQDHLYSLSRGTALQHVYAKDLKPLKIPVPPLEEQRLIVEALDDHLFRLDKALAEVEAVYRSSNLLRMAALETSLNVGFPMVRLENLVVGSGYGTSTKCVAGGLGVPVARIPNLVNGSIDMTDEKRVLDQTVDLKNLMLAPGDVLVIRTNGSQNLVGTTAVVPENINASFASYLIRFQVDRSKVHPEWVHLMFASRGVRKQIVELSASSAGQYNLGLSKLNSIEIPLPSIQDQNKILEEMSRVTSLIDSVQREREVLLTKIETLNRSILKEAFSGGLQNA